jgi:hypothetical protein
MRTPAHVIGFAKFSYFLVVAKVSHAISPTLFVIVEEMEKVVRRKVKFWAKATTRWKANAHVRQRKCGNQRFVGSGIICLSP